MDVQAITEPIIKAYMERMGKVPRTKIYCFVHFPVANILGATHDAMSTVQRHSWHPGLLAYLEGLR